MLPRSSSAPPREVPDHTLIRRIGQGAYGEVWLARNVLGSLRAVKIVLRSEFEDGRPYEREFAGISRFEPVSRKHPGFVNVLQVGRKNEEGYFYYVMELADDARSSGDCEQGQDRMDFLGADVSSLPSELQDSVQALDCYEPRTLALETQRRGELPLNECEEIGSALCGALVELHRHGLVHRDIKPSNIIFVGGAPKLADIGLVAASNEARSFVGTEGFIPPEGPGTPKADLYSLGIVLYVLSTGKSHRDFPEPPADLGARPAPMRDRWLEFQAIIHRACQADPGQRYATASEMASDLIRFRRGAPIKARHRWHRRGRLAGKLAPSALIAALGFSLLARFQRSPGPERGDADQVLKTPHAESTRNREAVRACELGRFFVAKRTSASISNALEHFERAARLDEGFAEAYAGIALCYNLLHDYADRPAREVRPKAKAAAEKALALDPRAADALSSLAIIQAVYEWDWPAAEENFQRALRLDPGNAEVHHRYSMFLSVTGRHEEALNHNARAIGLEPTSRIYQSWRGVIYYTHRDYAAAEEHLRKALLLDDAFPGARGQLRDLYEATGKPALALGEIRELDKRRLLSDKSGSGGSEASLATLASSLEDYWRRLRKAMDARGEGVRAAHVARACLGTGDLSGALDWIERAVEERDEWCVFLATDSLFDPLRGEPRFQTVLRKMGLQEHPRGLEAIVR